MKMIKIKFLPVLFALVSIPLFSADYELLVNREQIFVGEPLTLTVKFVSPKDDKQPEHKILVNGKDIFESDPISGYFLENSVVKKEGGKTIIAYELLVFLDADGHFIFNVEGDYKILLTVGDKSIEKTIKVLPVSASQKSTFDDYAGLREMLTLYFIGERDRDAYSKAEDFLKKYPDSIYSKLPALYCVSVGDMMSGMIIIENEKLEIGDKVDIEEFTKKRMAVHERNAKILSGFDFSNDGLIGERAELALLQNKLASISVSGKMPPKDEIEKISAVIDRIEKNTFFKKHLDDSAKIRAMLKEMQAGESIE
jgi:hypothetical protein